MPIQKLATICNVNFSLESRHSKTNIESSLSSLHQSPQSRRRLSFLPMAPSMALNQIPKLNIRVRFRIRKMPIKHTLGTAFLILIFLKPKPGDTVNPSHLQTLSILNRNGLPLLLFFLSHKCKDAARPMPRLSIPFSLPLRRPFPHQQPPCSPCPAPWHLCLMIQEMST